MSNDRKQSITYDAATGRIAESNGFAWEYLAGTNLKSFLTYPNEDVVSWTYEPHRDLLTTVTNATYSTYTYTNDLLGRRTSKNDEQYGYNVRDELIAADEVSYAYDDIGNRTTAEGKSYTANNLNQYTAIDDFVPQYDADGNQTLIKTETGIWSVIYNAENQPIRWQSGDTVITMAFDRMVVTSSSVRTETWPKHFSLPLGSPPQKILRGYASLFLLRSASVTPYSSPPFSSTATIESSLKTGFFKNDYLTVHFCITLASIVIFKK